eukprot:COSAG02_NODE_2153_length_9654_cov_6.361905_2_plen_60_part_00
MKTVSYWYQVALLFEQLAVIGFDTQWKDHTSYFEVVARHRLTLSHARGSTSANDSGIIV